jgi:hypothetical protein
VRRQRGGDDKLMARPLKRPSRRLSRLGDKPIVMALMMMATVVLCYFCLGSLKG